VISLVADANIQGHVTRLVARMQGEAWRDFWEHLQLRYLTFADIGLDTATRTPWLAAMPGTQRVSSDDNRRKDGSDSLEATIRDHNTSQSLPVFTIGDADSLLSGNDHADRVIDRLFRYLLEFDNLRAPADCTCLETVQSFEGPGMSRSVKKRVAFSFSVSVVGEAAAGAVAEVLEATRRAWPKQ